MPVRFEAAKGDPRLHAVVITADVRTGKATGIERLSLGPADLESGRS
jgi:calcineurin-like phosphoesterase